jgi:hypothetical protein
LEIEFNDILERVYNQPYWLSCISDAMRPTSRIGIHLAILAEPYLSKVLSGG